MTSSRESTIEFFEADLRTPLRNRKRLKLFLPELCHKEGRELAHLSYIFCSDAYLLAINREFLQHDDYTDIITFDYSNPKEPIDGEIYISVERVRENARAFGSTVRDELHRVIFHGALHLCGYGDKKTVDKKVMRQKEDFWLRKYLGKRST